MEDIECPLPALICIICKEEIPFAAKTGDEEEEKVDVQPSLSDLGRKVLRLVLGFLHGDVDQEIDHKSFTCTKCQGKLESLSREIENLVSFDRPANDNDNSSRPVNEGSSVESEKDLLREDFSCQVIEKEILDATHFKRKKGRPPGRKTTKKSVPKPNRALSTTSNKRNHRKSKPININFNEELLDPTQDDVDPNPEIKTEPISGAEDLEEDDNDDTFEYNPIENDFNYDEDDESIPSATLADETQPNEGNLKIKFKMRSAASARKKSLIRKYNKYPLKERPKGEYTCDECDCTFKTHFTLARHMKSHTGERPFKCANCNKSFSTKYQRSRHNITVHSKDKPYKCGDCPQSFSEKRGLSLHQLVHTGEKPYKCDECGGAFGTPYRLKLHVRSHLGICPYKCDQCPAAFTRSDTLKLHMRRHTGEKPVKCSICDKRFRSRTNYMQHVKTRHSDNPKTFLCTICSTLFGSKASLRNHSRKHTGEHPFLCSICGASFKYQSSYDYHKKTHMSEKPYKCPHCPMSFKIKQILMGHIRIHTGEKPFMCAVCGKAFSQRGQLGRHSVIHSDVKAHRCSICPKAFNRKDKLANHFQRIHNKGPGEERKSGVDRNREVDRPHKCPFCDKAYTRKSKVKEHMTKVHPNIAAPVEVLPQAPTESNVTNLQNAQMVVGLADMSADAMNGIVHVIQPAQPTQATSVVMTSSENAAMGVTSHLMAPMGRNMGYGVATYGGYPQNIMAQELNIQRLQIPNITHQYSENK